MIDPGFILPNPGFILPKPGLILPKNILVSKQKIPLPLNPALSRGEGVRIQPSLPKESLFTEQCIIHLILPQEILLVFLQAHLQIILSLQQFSQTPLKIVSLRKAGVHIQFGCLVTICSDLAPSSARERLCMSLRHQYLHVNPLINRV